MLLAYSSAPPKTTPNKLEPNTWLRFFSSLKDVEKISEASPTGIPTIRADAKSRAGNSKGSRRSNGKQYTTIKLMNHKPKDTFCGGARPFTTNWFVIKIANKIETNTTVLT